MEEDQELCQCCGFREIEFVIPALLCEPCWQDWFDTGCDAFSWRQLEWNRFFVRIGRPDMVEDPFDWPNKDEIWQFWRCSWEWMTKASRLHVTFFATGCIAREEEAKC